EGSVGVTPPPTPPPNLDPLRGSSPQGEGEEFASLRPHILVTAADPHHPQRTQSSPPLTDAEFAACMAGLGPFEQSPRLAAGVSGGADSMALALLADAWARERGGTLLALIVDHGLRRESGAEAAGVAARLGARGIAARVLTIRGLARGSALAERARVARFHILVAACAGEGILH